MTELCGAASDLTALATSSPNSNHQNRAHAKSRLTKTSVARDDQARLKAFKSRRHLACYVC